MNSVSSLASWRNPYGARAGRYSLQRPAFGAVLECIEVLRGTRQTLPGACVVLPSAGQSEIEPPENLIALDEVDQVTDRMASKSSCPFANYRLISKPLMA